jgi:Cu+-exporting ATPase
LKQDAAVVVEGLKSMDIKCILVTGNNWQTARSVADEVGIMDVMAEVLPAGKMKAI